MPGIANARTSVIILACKKEENPVLEDTIITPQKEEQEEQWGGSFGEKEKNISEQELEEDLEEMTGGEVFEKALEVQEGREEPREDGPLDLTQYSYLYPQTTNSATKKYFSEKLLINSEIAQERLRSVGNVDIPPPQRDRSPPRVSQASTSQEFSEESSSNVEDKKPTTTRKIIEKADFHLDRQPTPSPEEMLETVMTINIAEFEHFYSMEEKNYLTRFCDRGREKWLKVNFGTKQLQEFVNWCQFGGNLTAEFYKAANRQLNERYIRIMESTEEFPVMQGRDKLNLLRTNIGLTQMLTYVRSINTASADEEMTNVFGEADLLIWNKIKDKIPVRRTSDMFAAIPMPKKDLERFMFLVSQCRVPLIADQRVFSLLVPLLVYTTNQPNLVLKNRGEVDAARDQYMTVLHRYLNQKGEQVETKMKEVMEMMNAVKEMALLFNKANMTPALE